MSKMQDGPDKNFILEQINSEGFDQALLYSDDFKDVNDETFQRLLQFYVTASQAMYWYLGMDGTEIDLYHNDKDETSNVVPKKPKLELC